MIATKKRREKLYTASGGAAELQRCRDFEILIEGPSGTGKTRGVLQKINACAMKYPGIRVLLLRMTRKSLNDSVMETLENHVWWDGHPCITPVARKTRDGYTYLYDTNTVKRESWWPDWPALKPDRDGNVLFAGQSYFALGGMDHPDRFMSSEWDIIVLFEAKEIVQEKSWAKLMTRCRNHRMPYNQCIADTNPDWEGHFLNERASRDYEIPEELKGLVPPPRPGQKQMTRILSRHKDNPWVNPEYLAVLNALPEGAEKERLLRGKWVTESGLIWPMFDAGIHVLLAEEFRDDQGNLWLDIVRDGGVKDRRRIVSTLGAVDWGTRAPGVMQVWGIDTDERCYMLREIYKTEKLIDWWAEQAERLYKLYSMDVIVCDPENPGNIDMFNARIGSRGGQNVAIKANNDWRPGVDLVRTMLTPSGANNEPQMYFVADNLDCGRDQSLVDRSRPWCWWREIPQYVWKKSATGKVRNEMEEKNDPDCFDHSCDTIRYMAMHKFGRKLGELPQGAKYPRGSIGAILGHEQDEIDAAGGSIEDPYGMDSESMKWV